MWAAGVRWLRGAWSPWLLLAASAAAAFLRSLGATFTYDDRAVVVTNADVRGVNPWSHMWHHDFWGQPIDAVDSHKSYRPITIASLRIDHAIAGLRANWFHFHSLALHVGVTLALYRLARALLLPPRAALLMALVFAVHPVHTEAVCSIVARADLLCAALMLASLNLYLRARPPHARASRRLPSRRAWLRIAGALALAALSMLAKEAGIATFVAIAGLELLRVLNSVAPARGADAWLVDDDADDDAANTACTTRNGADGEGEAPKSARATAGLEDRASDAGGAPGAAPAAAGAGAARAWTRADLLPSALLVCLAAGLAVALTVVRLRLHGGAPLLRWSLYENVVATMAPGAARALSIGYLHAWYAWLLVWPRDLSPTHGVFELEVITGWSDARNAQALLLYALALVLATHLLRARAWTALWIAAALGVSPFLPASNVFIFVGAELAERLLYIPSIAACMAAGAAAHALLAAVDARAEAGDEPRAAAAPASSTWTDAVTRRPRRWRAASCALRAALCVGYAACVSWCVIRSGDWLNERALFERGVAVSPRNVKALGNLALLLEASRDPHEVARGTEMLHYLLRVFPDSPLALSQLAFHRRAAGDVRTAFELQWRAFRGATRHHISLPSSSPLDLAATYVDEAAAKGAERVEDTWLAEAGGEEQRSWLANLTRMGESVHPANLALLMTDGALLRGSRTCVLPLYRGMALFYLHRFADAAQNLFATALFAGLEFVLDDAPRHPHDTTPALTQAHMHADGQSGGEHDDARGAQRANRYATLSKRVRLRPVNKEDVLGFHAETTAPDLLERISERASGPRAPLATSFEQVRATLGQNDRIAVTTATNYLGLLHWRMAESMLAPAGARGVVLLEEVGYAEGSAHNLSAAQGGISLEQAAATHEAALAYFRFGALTFAHDEVLHMNNLRTLAALARRYRGAASHHEDAEHAAELRHAAATLQREIEAACGRLPQDVLAKGVPAECAARQA